MLKVWNQAGVSGLLGLFHCYKGGGQLTTSMNSKTIPGLKGERFAVYLNRQQAVSIVAADEDLQLTLDTAEYELVSYTPIQRGFAPIGLMDKFNHAAAIVDWVDHEHKQEVRMKDGGTILMYSEAIPLAVTVNGCETAFSYEGEVGLLQISAPTGGQIVIEVFLMK